MTPIRIDHYNVEWTDHEERPLPESGTFALGIYEQVPVEEYPFPDRPGALQPLDEGGLAPSGTEVARLDSAEDPLQPRTLELTLTERLEVVAVRQTPGTLEIRVNATLIHVHESWDYDLGNSASSQLASSLRDAGLDLAPGDQITVEVQARDVTGAWRVTVVEQSR